MPYHDLNTVYKADQADLLNTLTFQHELGYNTIAISLPVTGQLSNPLPTIPVSDLKRLAPPKLQLLTRLTLTISDTAQNHRMNALQSAYDIIALRPTTEKTFQLCCNSLECDLISLDLSQRIPFLLKFTTASAALQRGVRFEICYSVGISNGTDARRNLISGTASLIRATRGRGIIISSEASNALGIRAPADVINLAQVWGLSSERGKEAVCEEAGKVVKFAALKRTSYRGVVDIVNGGAPTTNITATLPPASGKKDTSQIAMSTKVTTTMTKPPPRHESLQTSASADTGLTVGAKRKASAASLDTSSVANTMKTTISTAVQDDQKPLSKREMKRRAKKARMGEN